MADVETPVELAVESLRRPDLLVGQVVISQLHHEMDHNLKTDPEFMPRVRDNLPGVV